MVQQYLPGLILNTILKIIAEMDDPYQTKPGLGGMTAYPPKAMGIVCMLMKAEMVYHTGRLSATSYRCGPQDRTARSTIQEYHLARLRDDTRVVPTRDTSEDRA